MEDNNFIIPKKLHDKYGYDKKVATGKWFNFEDVRFKLKYVRESKEFRTRLTKMEKLDEELKNGKMTPAKEFDILSKYCGLLIGSVILDWDLQVKAKDENGKAIAKKAELTADLLARFFSKYYTVLDQILVIFVDNKQFHGVNKKK